MTLYNNIYMDVFYVHHYLSTSVVEICVHNSFFFLRDYIAATYISAYAFCEGRVGLLEYMQRASSHQG